MFLVLEGTLEELQRPGSLFRPRTAKVAMPDSTVLHGRRDAQPSFRANKPVVSEQRRESQHTFPLRGAKDTPPYLHDGRLLTLEDTVEYFNLILGTKLSSQEKE